MLFFGEFEIKTLQRRIEGSDGLGFGHTSIALQSFNVRITRFSDR